VAMREGLLAYDLTPAEGRLAQALVLATFDRDRAAARVQLEAWASVLGFRDGRGARPDRCQKSLESLEDLGMVYWNRAEGTFTPVADPAAWSRLRAFRACAPQMAAQVAPRTAANAPPSAAQRELDLRAARELDEQLAEDARAAIFRRGGGVSEAGGLAAVQAAHGAGPSPPVPPLSSAPNDERLVVTRRRSSRGAEDRLLGLVAEVLGRDEVEGPNGGGWRNRARWDGAELEEWLRAVAAEQRERPGTVDNPAGWVVDKFNRSCGFRDSAELARALRAKEGR